ncbi:CobW/HypB/UreG, nucleotide-binding domain-containing protein [Globomyces pollinis-pini]|nr:CobW/HypB/UreG, nucleotide-binding domain-containing protein [Globomyces pollinis-pini]
MAESDDDIPDLVPDAVPTPSLQQKRRSSPVPVTIITGFLGSGKTTLIMRLLNDPNQQKKIAVILNEFGESTGIDKSLSLGKDGKITEEWLELANGCFCCSVKDMGVKAIENLLLKNAHFDYVLLETTGLADPGPIASMFWLDDALQSELYLDGIVTVVDSKYISKYLGEKKQEGSINEATKQIALADRIILNKIDLIDEETRVNLEIQLKSINSVAVIERVTRSNVPIDFIFDLHSFDQNQVDPFSEQNAQHTSHSIDSSVKTIVFYLSGVVQNKELNTWIQTLLWDKFAPGFPDHNMDVIRFKALINMENSDSKHVVQAVQELFDVQVGISWGSEERKNKLVFIGRDLDKSKLQASFEKHCLQK